MNEEMMRILTAMARENENVIDDMAMTNNAPMVADEPLITEDEAMEYMLNQINGNENVSEQYRNINNIPNLTTKFVNINGCTMGIITDMWTNNGEQHSEELMTRFYNEVVVPAINRRIMR